MASPTVIDLFSGPGGFSEGFRQEGYNILLGVDYDENSAKTYTTNHPQTEFICADLSDINPQQILQTAGIESGTVTILLGGPPCQGFSIAGNRNQDDTRNRLFKEFARYIDVIQPSFFLMENVPGLLSMDTPEGNPVIEVIQETFSELGYTSEYKILTASEYGVPQNRKRVFILGTRKSVPITFPTPTHTTHKQAESKNLNPYITVDDALSDLPSLKPGEQAKNYTHAPENRFQEKMREQMDETDTLQNHNAVNHRNHIVERFKHIPQGGNMTDAPEKHQPTKVYSSRNRRLPEDKPSYTVTSHVLDELIHPYDNRAITVRESARLQCFPDHYIFKGKRNVFHGSDETSQYEQLGNAVPVEISRSLAKHIQKMYL